MKRGIGRRATAAGFVLRGPAAAAICVMRTGHHRAARATAHAEFTNTRPLRAGWSNYRRCLTLAPALAARSRIRKLRHSQFLVQRIADVHAFPRFCSPVTMALVFRHHPVGQSCALRPISAVRLLSVSGRHGNALISARFRNSGLCTMMTGTLCVNMTEPNVKPNQIFLFCGLT